MKFFNRNKKYSIVEPEEIFLDSSNFAKFNRDQFEGRIVKSISKFTISSIKYIFLVFVFIFIAKAFYLQVIKGEYFSNRAINNSLKKEIIFAHRGVIVDRNDIPLAWNTIEEGISFDKRKYILDYGFSNLLGFVKYPQKDSSGRLYSFETLGQDGLEKFLDDKLKGVNGAKLTETNVKGEVEGEGVIESPLHGEKVELSIDSRVQKVFYENLKEAVDASNFSGGAGVIMDVNTGEVLSIVTYPEFSSTVMTEGVEKEKIKSYLQNKDRPFLERAITGLYAPGSIVKPFIALGLLTEKIIDPEKKIESIGYLSLPNPYNPSKPTIFKDWKAHGFTNMKEALAVSSDVYFYITGGGFGNQKGLGIQKIYEYMHKFLFGTATHGFFASPTGTIPNPEWKKENFDGEEWTVGNTYHTAIGQYGFQVTPIQIARAISGIATEGTIVEPTIIKNTIGQKTPINSISKESYKIVKEGMREAVLWGTARAINFESVSAGAKTGTAEIGSAKQKINSWVEGFFPYENPKYSFVVVLDDGPSNYSISSMQIMGKTLRWIAENIPEYIQNTQNN